MTRVLIVEDDAQLSRALRINLRARGYEVEVAADGATALRRAGTAVPELVILDLGLPDMDGAEVIAGLRGWSQAPIIVLTARDSQTDKVFALDAGADDYLTKPFGMDELLARMRAMRRRVHDLDVPPVVQTDSFIIDLGAKRVTTTAAGEVRLTRTEWHLLEVLARHPGKLITQRQLLLEIWGPGYEKETGYLRVFMSQLRRKLEPDPSQPRHLITEPGIGYRLEA
jgi:two-component system KDP operon response regulator KdpE